MLFIAVYLIYCLIISVESRKGNAAITISTEMRIEHISNIDFNKQTFDIVVEVEHSLTGSDSRDTRESFGGEQTSNLFYDIRFDAVDNQKIGDVEYVFQNSNVKGMRRKEKLTVLCHFSHFFPFDHHTCVVKMISRKFPSDMVLLKWRTPLQISIPPSNVPYLVLNKVTPITCMHNLGLLPTSSSSSVYVAHSCLGIRFEFTRPLCIAIYRFYGPSSLLLFLEWLSFYVNRSDLVSRVILVSISICVQIFICCFFIYSSASHVSTATPADAWCALLAAQSTVVVIFLFVSIAMESRVRKYRSLSSGSRDVRDDSRSRHERRAMRSAMYKKESVQADKSAYSYSTVVESHFRRYGDHFSLYAARIDIVGRVACPLLYIVVTSLYFLLYMLSPHE
ncbi:hypothetical protein Y032_0245g3540 [Ancylostoma ceylanicum]|nr:hypothetical protein Y032_0245g3540 [Ancylostoma ceylanicum]